MSKTKVIFLHEKVGIDVYAYFPEVPQGFNGYRPDNYTCYSHVGQHSACHPDYAKECKEAPIEQYGYLKKELEGLGYDLEIISRYELDALLFLQSTGTTFTTAFKHYGSMPNWDDKNTQRDVFTCTLKNGRSKYRFAFGQSTNKSTGTGDNPPTAYDVLACITKSDPGTFDDFCSEFGYDTDSRSAYKTYKAVMREWKNIELLFSPEQIEKLMEIY